MAMKHCSKCFEVLPMNKNYFGKDKRRPLGFRSECNGCRRDYHNENRETINAKNREYGRKNREYLRDYYKIYYKENREKVNLKNRMYYKNNAERLKKYQKDFVRKNRQRYRNYNQNYYHKTRSLISTFSPQSWQQCLTYFNHQCAYCGSTESLEQEHVIPVSRGGHYTPDNIIPACRSCNASKNNKIMQDWFTQHENYSVERMANILKYVQKNKTEVNI